MCNHTAVAKLPVLRPGKRQAGHLRVNSLYVFWLLLCIILFSRPTVALAIGTVDLNDVCTDEGAVKTYTEYSNDNPYEIKTTVVTCTCTHIAGLDELLWVCKAKDQNE
jgi:hypothetical protein